jgi:Cu+-exporting ATPase
MHCQSCVNMTRNVLGDDSEVDFNKKQATILVDSQNEANDLLEDLLDVGLDAQLENVEQQKNESISVVTSTSSNKKRNIKNQHETLLEGEPSQNAGQPNHDPLAPPARRTATLTRSPKGDNSAIVEMIVGGMTCSMCSQAITRTLHQMPGVRNVHVSLATNVAKIQYSEPAVSLEDLKEAIESIGYSVQHVLSDAQSSMEQLQRAQDEDVFLKRRAFLWSLVGTIPITVITMILPHLFPNNALHRWLHASVGIRGHSFPRESLILALLATPVQFGSGFSFYRTSYHNISSGSLGMDVLVSIGTTASYLYAWIQTYGGEEAHAFETSAVLITFILLGKWMQNLAVRRTSQALTQLMKLQSKTAILVKDGKEETVPIDQVRPDDHVKIIRGASIPADGVVVDGEIMVDESAMTGESMPILKTPGSLVLGGTVCTESSGAFVRVTGVGENTALAQIVKLVQDAQTRKVPIQSLADTISAVFVPTVVTLAVLTYLVWYALCCTGVVPTEWHKEEGDATFSLMFGIACLVISCPCALGLATPTAIMVGTGVGARVGVLMKGGETLEYCSKVSAVVFDKTGTLTISKPRITDLETVGFSGSRDQLLWFLASLEVNSEHPLGRAVVDYATHEMDKAFSSKNPLVAPQAFQAKTGRGAKGQIKNLTVAIGNRAFVKEGGCAIPENIEMKMISMEEEGKTAVLAAMDNNIVAVLGIADEIKSDAAATIQYLKQTMGIDVWMVTGDNFRTATAVGRKLGLDESHIISEALPVAKVHQVKKLQKEGKIVLMCGDGINDSAALASAHVGMSLGMFGYVWFSSSCHDSLIVDCLQVLELRSLWKPRIWS